MSGDTHSKKDMKNGNPPAGDVKGRSDRPVEEFYAGAADAFSELYDPDKIYSRKEYPANYFRLRILLERIGKLGGTRVIDMGMGEGTPAVRVAALGREVCGFDTTPGMIDLARKNFREHGLDTNNVILADIEDPESYQVLMTDGLFDIALCLGVMPHVRNEELVLNNIRGCLKVGGRAFVSFRNPIFSLFTMNRYTHDFIIDELLSPVAEGVKGAVSLDLQKRLEMDKPSPRLKTEKGHVGYDAIRSEFHNPFEVPDLFRGAGFGTPRIHWYHFHPAPPFLEKTVIQADDFRAAAVALEETSQDWRGYFLSSAYMVEAEAAPL